MPTIYRDAVGTRALPVASRALPTLRRFMRAKSARVRGCASGSLNAVAVISRSVIERSRTARCLVCRFVGAPLIAIGYEHPVCHRLLLRAAGGRPARVALHAGAVAHQGE